ncbi:D-alanyl-D-alanine carboxypeptidase [Bacillus sp. BRMEA1]|uniref:D-alanyl-D-alanine carboxypeptidase family protein n=1 Tax=Neobacillus endophyticus TaxID=2738405 RepID=UPI0015669AB7|nr:D-alanyl-D-alanine carboxypeptidase family protein [Neobacillus endophyticus]NRD76772.1 D-alanyl-D-alanine carboxypeptidase [Neobacillus endophyticus]
MKTIIVTLALALYTIAGIFPLQARAAETVPPITGQYGIAIDAVTGEILYNKNADQKAYPASMTKVLTSIILDEKMPDSQMLTVSANAAGQECSCLEIKAGEKISKEDALYSLLLLSANDVAVAIAENVAGSVPGFATLMNDEVKKLGLKNTHFVTPNGLHDPNHYTTAHDMALIMKEALKHPNVLKALSTQSVDIKTSLQTKRISNHSLVHKQPNSHVIAGKTGYTDIAQNTLVEYLEKDNKQVIAVVMKTNLGNEYSDIQKMANYAFDHMKVEKVVSKGSVVGVKKVNGKYVDLIADSDVDLTEKSDENVKFNTKIDLFNTYGKSVEKGQSVGNLLVMENGEILKEIPLITNKAIPKESKVKPVTPSIESTSAIMIFIGIMAALLAFFSMIRYLKIQRSKQFDSDHPASN